jgi:hypothetical protein
MGNSEGKTSPRRLRYGEDNYIIINLTAMDSIPMHQDEN